MKKGYTYILANQRPSLYTGVTSDLITRVGQHKQKLTDSFTAKYNITKLVYFECIDTIMGAIVREKQIKNMSRAEKMAMITEFNPTWKDLYYEISQ